MSYERISTLKVGENKGAPRVWLEGQYLLRADFAPGRLLSATFEPDRVVIRLAEDGARKVSSKGGGAVPVIDLNTSQLRDALGAVDQVQVKITTGEIVITPTRTARKIAARVRNGKSADVFAGGGTLSEAAKQAGFQPIWAVERSEKYADVYEANNPGVRMINACVSDVYATGPDGVARDPIELLCLGIPCEPYSAKRRNQPGTKLPPEAHELGDMVFWALKIIDAANPHSVLCEEVPGFLESGAGHIFVNALRRMGYTVSTQVIDPTDHGSLTGRKRAVIVATTGDAFEWPAPIPNDQTLGDVLDPDAGGWFDRESKGWLFAHWDKQTEKGNGFAPTPLTPDARKIGTISKRYFAIQGDGQVIAHPTKPGTVRQFTLSEVKRIHGVRADYYLGDSKTTAGEILGQGVEVRTFARLAKLLKARA
jgi:DNA (cytosine-5)-methyltransferase 1